MAMVDMGDLLTELRTEYAATTSIKQLVFTTQIKKPVTVYGNRELLKKLIENLVENSIHYTPPKGFILLECEKIGDACQIHVNS
jgi:signal transduction histidine kinase